ncbi:hypothetical protein [Candidatus Magnetobacterium casense]|uniref:Uncharacterized protein n=1 Tax=Candidatus Magnetobacterium casense TaxID=1455061 RepID=A0ABS6RU69_9BACT|nr:hypothetical protein [Candidatus Magnetobacterium casensis]MBV6340172.1 hypothetical protein [Candidatus Magnetobacterium casensis]
MADLAKGSVSVEFKISCSNTGDDKSIKVEADSALNGSCLRYGDLFHFKIYAWGLPKGYSITMSDVTITAAYGGHKSEDKEESLTFANVDEANVGYPVDLLGATTWYGNSLGLTPTLLKKTTVKYPKVGVAAGTLKYTTSYDAYSFTVTPKTSETYPVIVFVEEKP